MSRFWRLAPFLVGLGAGVAVGPTAYRATEALRLMIFSARQPLWRYPAGLNMRGGGGKFSSGGGGAVRGGLVHLGSEDG